MLTSFSEGSNFGRDGEDRQIERRRGAERGEMSAAEEQTGLNSGGYCQPGGTCVQYCTKCKT